MNNYDGVLIDHSSGNKIVSNVVANNTIASSKGSGIRLDLSSNNTIVGNIIASNKGLGIWSVDSASNTVAWNNITGNEVGIRSVNSSSSVIISNIIASNKLGIELYFSSDNLIYNNLFNNTLNTRVENSVSYWNTTLSLGRNIVGGNWIGGNYWATPDGKGYSQLCRDVREPIGICDEPYKIDKNNADYLPLASPGEKATQQLTETMGMTITTIITPPPNTTPETTQQTLGETASIEWTMIIVIGVGIAVLLLASLYFLARRR